MVWAVARHFARWAILQQPGLGQFALCQRRDWRAVACRVHSSNGWKTKRFDAFWNTRVKHTCIVFVFRFRNRSSNIQSDNERDIFFERRYRARACVTVYDVRFEQLRKPPRCYLIARRRIILYSSRVRV